jgi:cytochrome oxidase Cu insertion factor (SCO1/SenC/PrrC family)
MSLRDVRSKRSRLKLFLVIAMFLAPAPLAWLAHQYWRPTSLSNYGELISPQALRDDTSATEQGRPFTWASLQGKWVMVQIHDGPCDAACERKLYLMRQVRLTQGRDKDRIERLWLAMTPTGAKLPAGYEGTHMVWHAEGLAAQFPAPGSPANHIYLVDPRGNLMLRFPESPDPKGMIRDLKRLIKYTWVEGK